MSRKGNCWNNAPVESFFSTLKTECPELEDNLSASKTARTVFEYIEIYYNQCQVAVGCERRNDVRSEWATTLGLIGGGVRRRFRWRARLCWVHRL